MCFFFSGRSPFSLSTSHSSRPPVLMLSLEMSKGNADLNRVHGFLVSVSKLKPWLLAPPWEDGGGWAFGISIQGDASLLPNGMKTGSRNQINLQKMNNCDISRTPGLVGRTLACHKNGKGSRNSLLASYALSHLSLILP